eukprot:SAG25_NODE_8541_length_416_cov_1.958991_1_plen_76_part_01
MMMPLVEGAPTFTAVSLPLPPHAGHSIRGPGEAAAGWRSRIHLLTQIDRSIAASRQQPAMQKGSDPHTARVRSVSE